MWLRRGDKDVSTRKHRDELARLAGKKSAGVDSAASDNALSALRGELSAAQAQQRVTSAVTGFGPKGNPSEKSVLAELLPDLHDNEIESLEHRVRTDGVEQTERAFNRSQTEVSSPRSPRVTQGFQRLRGAVRATAPSRRPSA
jgi:hypothetical protein